MDTAHGPYVWRLVTVLHACPALAVSLAAALAERERTVRVRWLPDTPDAGQRLEADTPDVLVISSCAQGGDALALVRRLKVERPAAAAVVSDMPDSTAALLECATAGARGVVARDASLDELVAAVEAALGGEVFCSSRLAFRAFRLLADLSSRRDRAALADSGLSVREIEVHRLLIRGLSNQEIAEQLCLSTSTVKNHVHRILKKLELRTRPAASAAPR